MVKNLIFLVLGIVIFFSFSPRSIAGQADSLINKLVEKGIITDKEAQTLLEDKEQGSSVSGQQCSNSVPDWIQHLKLSGDFCLRYQYEDRDTISSGITTAAKRERARIRFRVGLQEQVLEGLSVKAGLASGSADPRSTNQTLQDNFSSKPIQLDYAYADYDVCEHAKILAGKIQYGNTLWLPSNLLWDSDINPEGLEIKLKSDENKLWVNTGYFIIDEISAGADPTMFFVQPGIYLDLDKISLKGSFNYYATNSVKGLDYSNIVFGSASNTTAGTPAAFVYDYDCWGFSGEAGKKEFIKDILDYGAVFFDYINNPDPGSENTGYLLGLKFGDEKIKTAGNWQAMIDYRRLGKDAWLDFLPNSSFLSGQTDAEGYEYVLQYALAENVSLAISYYQSQTIKAAVEEKEDFLLIDCNLRF